MDSPDTSSQTLETRATLTSANSLIPVLYDAHWQSAAGLRRGQVMIDISLSASAPSLPDTKQVGEPALILSSMFVPWRQNNAS